ncbi:MAG: 6-hydroxymethylpterin diphosphokinase MptE-like protein [Desulfuromonadaceae bacterium]
MTTIMNRVASRSKREIGQLKKKTQDIYWSLSSEGLANRLKLLALKGKFAGQRCFIIANGPSLLKCDLTLLKNEVTICSNAQYLIWDKMGFIPNFLTVEDRLVAEDRCSELNAIEQVTKIFPLDLAYCLKNVGETIFINFVRDHKNFPRFSSNFSRVVYWGGTVSALNLQLAYYLGCSEIYLIGFDHEYKVPDKMDNFVITSEADDVNHIHPDYFGKGYRWHDPNVERMEKAYIEARRFLDANNVLVRNATIEGKLEVFERVNYLSLFKTTN